MTPHADHERNVETGAIGAVQSFEGGKAGLIQAVEPELALLVRRECRQGALARGTAGEVGMAPEEGELRLARR